MNIPADQLDKWRAFVEQVRLATFNARRAAAAGNREQHDALMRDLHGAAITTARDMERAGAERPATLPAPPDVPLHLLNTPASRRYLDAIRTAYGAALALDAERYGEIVGTDGPATQQLAALLDDATDDVLGAVGRLVE